MCTNFAKRYCKNIHSRQLDQRLIHSRFIQTRTFRWKKRYFDENYIKCCDFLTQNRLVVGTNDGNIKVYNLFTGQKELVFTVHDSSVDKLETSNNGKLLLSSSMEDAGTSLWSIDNKSISHKYFLNEVEYCTFSNHCQNKLLGSLNELAVIYDVETSKRLMTLGMEPSDNDILFNNKPVFDATNKLVLSEGVLWDATSGKRIHKLAKLYKSQYLSNDIFHPKRMEIISNTKVWDLRTFQLLRSVSSLDGCNVLFPITGEGMYAYLTTRRDKPTSFKTLDPNDYTTIATVNTKNESSINHMVCNTYDTQIAIVAQNYHDGRTIQIYDVGRSRAEDEPIEEEQVQSDGSGMDLSIGSTESDSG
ncbi:DDB1- and CUL4-associated factor 1-like [Adelges cooleyi]|uniref:DDB1- and CUL4-associated factor 1-like n=1 Tax=Adelges cooleyi TaxID=133065 RepID=UPI00217F614D|nr:DDB1- and CUL4-associated factor 1-like [Adelges cooleyi]XP_050426225.1 DDB1- and CUL4-associated factor 1-like [Adelges cooleyi]XP_050426226.1 DDB1- and CUL4-associated factor 1-like [Adelges cooleyi]XP_050426227.1 DDB1- and CUL4-associated factor 1-like [Adelges cooleyi]